MTMRMFRSSTPAARSSSSTTGTACTLTPIQSLRISATLLELFTWSASGAVPIGFLIASLTACGTSASAGGILLSSVFSMTMESSGTSISQGVPSP